MKNRIRWYDVAQRDTELLLSLYHVVEFPITAHLEVFYSSYTTIFTAVCQH